MYIPLYIAIVMTFAMRFRKIFVIQLVDKLKRVFASDVNLITNFFVFLGMCLRKKEKAREKKLFLI